MNNRRVHFDVVMNEEEKERWENFHLFVAYMMVVLTLTLLVMTIDAVWEGMGDVGSERYEPALLPPCPTIRV